MIKSESKRKYSEYVQKIKRKVFLKLGGVCNRCGCDVIEALEVNHKYGGGNEERRTWSENNQYCSATAIYLAILNGSRTTDDLELLCKICNTHHYLTEIKGVSDNWKIIWTRKRTETLTH